MSASSKDIALTIISNGERAYYSSVKNAGNLIWDIRLGVFSGSCPKADQALQFLRGTDWEDCTETLRKPLVDPVYGSVTIDFDQKIVTDANGWGSSDRIFFSWLTQSISAAMYGACGLVPEASLLEHFAQRRIQLEVGPKHTAYGDPLSFDSLVEAKEKLQQVEDLVWNEHHCTLSFARIALPTGWKLTRSDE